MDYLSSIGWVRVPCFAVFHLGSCTYPDVCAWVPNEGTHEEAVIEGTNICRCPIHKVDNNLYFYIKLLVNYNCRVLAKCIWYHVDLSFLKQASQKLAHSLAGSTEEVSL